MRVHVRRVDDRLRAWKVEIEISAPFSPRWLQALRDAGRPDLAEQWRDEEVHLVLTPRMLATAPLVEAETFANLPYEAWQIEDGDWDELPEAPQKLAVPNAKPYPRQFWEDVAATYIELVLVYGVRNPAVAIAENTGSPVATVRGWIAKCRQLGLIAKGSQGRVG
jgi:hypothetical protein